MDALVIGCGLCGSAIARYLAEDCNKQVLVIDRRNHIAGNMFDYMDNNNMRVQKYGPHTFHTNHENLYKYILKFAEWEEYKLECMAYIDGKFTPTPFNFETIDQFFPVDYGEALKKALLEYYNQASKATIVEMLNSDNKLIKDYAQFLFDKDYKLYTSKQWGISPSDIDPSVLKRVPVYFSYQRGYFDDKYQVMPKKGFTDFFANILNNPNITIQLGVNAKDILSLTDENILIDGKFRNIPVIYTGAIDELLDYKYGLLPYRSLEFDFRTENMDSYQDAPVVAYPQAEGYTRITEFKKLPVQNINGVTSIAIEYSSQYDPNKGNEPYYPIITVDNVKQYEMYKNDLSKYKNLYLCGRLADYKYYNMDQALARALAVSSTLPYEPCQDIL